MTATTEPKTPLEEFVAEHRRMIEEGSKLGGAEGAFFRLCARLDPHEVTDWMTAELERCTTMEDIYDGFSAFAGAAMMPVAMTARAECKDAAMHILGRSFEQFCSQVDDPTTPILMVNRVDGRQFDGTLQGFMLKGGPK